MDKIQIGSFAVEKFQIDVGMLLEGHNALPELDILKISLGFTTETRIINSGKAKDRSQIKQNRISTIK